MEFVFTYSRKYTQRDMKGNHLTDACIMIIPLKANVYNTTGGMGNGIGDRSSKPG